MSATIYAVVGIAVFLVGVMVVPEKVAESLGGDPKHVSFPEIFVGSAVALLAGLLWPVALAILGARLTARYIRTRLKKENV